KFDRTPGGDAPYVLTNVSGRAYFAVPQPGKGLELWRTDGTPTGTFPVRDGYPPPDGGSLLSKPVNCNGTVFFTANRQELWRTDGTATGTSLVKDLALGPDGSELSHLVNRDGALFFTRS